MHSIGTWWMWLGFFSFVIMVIFIDMFLLGGKKSHRVSVREASSWMAVWVSCAFIFNGLLWWYVKETQNIVIANQKAIEFFTGYLIEQSLSIDNMFAFIMIFHYFLVPPEYQRRVLLYGVLSAIVLRFIMILGGTLLVQQFHWILYVFGLFLVLTGIRMMFPEEKEKDLGKNPLLRWLRRHVRVLDTYDGEKFLVKRQQWWYVTPLFLVLVLIEVSDVVFALDSIPAIFAVTNDPFIVFTSNIFAILGLRALYFLLFNMAARFHLLRYGIAIMLTFIGIKMLIAPWIKIPIGLALGVVVAILGTTILLSILVRRRLARKEIVWKKNVIH